MSSHLATPNTEASILTRIIESDERELSPEIARYLTSIKLPPEDEARVNELSAKARAGSLSDSESTELEGYLHIGSLLGVMQSRARRVLSGEERPPRQ